MKKQITVKRKKTEADENEIAHIEFLGSLYLNENGPVIPVNVVEGLIVATAKKFREGQVAKSGMYCVENARLEYDGPRTANELWEDEHFRLRVMTVNPTTHSHVATTRPIFNDWSVIITINIEDTLINPARVDEWMEVAGTQVGLCDWRPQHGRFTAERLNGK